MNFGQTIWDKTLVLLGTSWETHLGTIWEQGEKTNIPVPAPPPPPQKEKTWIVHGAC
jgi:hypothetical protein